MMCVSFAELQRDAWIARAARARAGDFFRERGETAQWTVFLVYGAICLTVVRLYTSFMAASRKSFAATDVNVLICALTFVNIILSAGLSGTLAAHGGYVGAYAAAAGWTLLGSMLAARSGR